MDHPRRLGELVSMLEDKDRSVRGRAANTLARLSESHPERLIRIAERLRENLADDSAYVRWNLVYVLGRMGARFPLRAPRFLTELSTRLDDENRVVRVLASKALARIAMKDHRLIEEVFAKAKREIPAIVARELRVADKAKPKRPRKH